MTDEVKSPKYPIRDDIEVPEKELEAWQKTIDVLAEIAGVPAALVLRVHAQEIEVFLSSHTPGNVYHPGEKAPLDSGLYCETVMSTRRKLLVPNALKDPLWDKNPDISRGMISYCGLPLTWPSGEIFGTICILDKQENAYLQQTHYLMERFRDSIQFSLEKIYNASGERTQAEAALRESEKKYRALFEGSRDAVMTLEPPTWKFTSGNPAMVAMFGARNEEHFVSLGPWELSPEKQPDGRPSAEKAREMIETAMREGSHFFDWTHQRIDGRTFSSTVLLSRIELAGKVFLQATVRDITEQKQAEEELKRLAHKISLILNSTAEGIYGVDLDGKVTFINPAAARMLGYEVEELLGRQSHTTWHHSSPDGTALPVEQCNLIKVLKEGPPSAAESGVFWKRDGSKLSVEYSSTPMVEADTLVGAVVVFKDITSRLHEEQERKKLEDQLRHFQKMEAIGLLAGGIAHDFNNILTVIIGYGQVALMKMPQDDPLRTNIDHILGAAERAASLTQSLLIFSRKQISETKPVDLNAVIKKVEKFLIRVMGEDIAIHLTLAERDLTILADAGQLEQVFMNLATNARDAMPKGGSFLIETTCVELGKGFVSAHGFGKPGTYAMTSVTDTGGGINEEKRIKIFEPFFTTKEVDKGTGLGLAMVYGIVKQNEGYINVYSEPGKGTTFHIYLPLIKTSADENLKAAEVPHPQSGTETILLAEDDADLLQLSVNILEQMGYTVITASNGEEAVAKFMENRDRIQLLLFDMMMPKKSGREAADEIRQVMPTVPVLFVSGYSPEMLCEKELIEQGAVMINKPMSPQALLKKVREVLDK